MDSPLENLDCEYFFFFFWTVSILISQFMILLGLIWIGPGKRYKKTEKRNSQIYFLIMKCNPLRIRCHFILIFIFIMLGVSQIITFSVWKASLLKSEFMFVWRLDTKETCKKSFPF